MRASRAIEIVRTLRDDRGTFTDGLAGEESEALSVVLELAETAEVRLPRLLAPGEEIPPGCTASLRAAIVSGPAAAPSAEASGPYTRAQFAAAVDEAHAALHSAVGEVSPAAIDDDAHPDHIAWYHVTEAHEALHRVGAGLERVDCATADQEAQRLLADLIEAGKRPLPCGHLVEDLIGGTDPATGRPLVTKCGACLAEQPKREPVPSRSFLPQGCTSEQIATAAGVAARELCAEHEPGVGVLADRARRARRGRAWAASERLRDAQARLDKARAEFRTYYFPEVPPERVIRELAEAENELARLRGGA